MKIPRCPKTVTGKHKWNKPTKWYNPEAKGSWAKARYPHCEHCGMVDDRKKI